MENFEETKVELVESCFDAGSANSSGRAGSMSLTCEGEDDRIRRDIWVIPAKSQILQSDMSSLPQESWEVDR
jgi:hypothetical protein